MSENQGNITDTFFSKLKEQSFTIILLVGILWYQNNTYKTTLADYKDQLDKKDQQILLFPTHKRIRIPHRHIDIYIYYYNHYNNICVVINLIFPESPRGSNGSPLLSRKEITYASVPSRHYGQMDAITPCGTGVAKYQ
jgi:hypothetical protein